MVQAKSRKELPSPVKYEEEDDDSDADILEILSDIIDKEDEDDYNFLMSLYGEPDYDYEEDDDHSVFEIELTEEVEKAIYFKIANWIEVDTVPISIVESDEFKQFMNCLFGDELTIPTVEVIENIIKTQITNN